MDLGIKDRVALVAGGKGNRYATALELAREGAVVTFPASERGSCITGLRLGVDGGWVRGLF